MGKLDYNVAMEQPAKEADLEARMDRVDSSLTAMLRSVDRRFDAVDQRFDAMALEIAGQKVETERIETSLLTEFHKWARTHEVRTRGVSAAVIGF